MINSSDVKICPTIIVKIRCSNADAVPCPAQARFLGNIGKCSVMIVVIQAVVKARTLFRQRRYPRAICEEDVEKAVVVVIQQCDSTENAVDDRLVNGGSVVQNKIYTGLRLAIFEADSSRVLGRSLRAHLPRY